MFLTLGNLRKITTIHPLSAGRQKRGADAQALPDALFAKIHGPEGVHTLHLRKSRSIDLSKLKITFSGSREKRNLNLAVGTSFVFKMFRYYSSVLSNVNQTW